jgi:hypothetical protein
MCYFQYVPKITLFLRNIKRYNHLSYNTFTNNPLVQPYMSASDRTGDGCIPGSHSSGVPRGEGFGVFKPPPPEIPLALQNCGKPNPVCENC